MNLILISMGVLGATGLVAAVLLYVVSQIFKVEEDPRIDLVVEACVKAGGTDGLACPVGGEPTMEDVKRILTPSDAEEAAAPAAQEGGEKKGFDPVIAAKIKALATPKASFPNSILMAQKL